MLLLALAACERAPRSEPAPPEITATAAEGPENIPSPRDEEPESPPPPAANSQTQIPPADFAESLDAIRRLPPRDAIAKLGRLLASEKRPERRVELLDSLDASSGEIPAKLTILRRELFAHRTTPDVREAAIDALLNIQHHDAIPIWKSLEAAGDEETKELAQGAIRALESLSK